jgi:maleate cis-trans isomerase
MYGWRARIGNISPTACAEILPYEFYRVAPDGVTFVTTNLLIRDARESSEVEASWQQFETAIENLVKTRVDYITLSGAPLVLAKGVERHRELLKELRQRSPVPADTSPQAFADGLKFLGATKLAVATSFIPAYNELVKQFLVSEAFEVLGIETLDTGLTSLEKATLSPLQVYQHVKAVGRRYPNCDAVLITSAAWPTLTMIQALEDDLGKPVVSSSVGQIWNPLHELGIRTRISGYGTLLRTLSGEKSVA